MYTEIKRTLDATKEEAQYDMCAKRLLANKSILAHILVRTVKAFQDMDWQEVEKLIEGEPLISQVPIEPGDTNQKDKEDTKGKRIVGLNTLNEEQAEGYITFDILFYVRMPDGVSKIIIDVEPQKDTSTTYKIKNRAVYYDARMISSQKERDFTGMNYDDIKQVYTIFICMNMKECILSYIHLTEEQLLGSYQWEGDLDLINILMIGITNELPSQEQVYKLHRLLTTLFSTELEANIRETIIKEEYQIEIEEAEGKEFKIMCNLSQGIKERAMAEGMSAGLSQGLSQGRLEGKQEIISKMFQKGTPVEQIALMIDWTVQAVEELLDKVYSEQNTDKREFVK